MCDLTAGVTRLLFSMKKRGNLQYAESGRESSVARDLIATAAVECMRSSWCKNWNGILHYDVTAVICIVM